MAVDSWAAEGMDWDNPDPMNWRYWAALYAAIRERESVLRIYFPSLRTVPSTTLFCPGEKMVCLDDYAEQISNAISWMLRDRRFRGENNGNYGAMFVDLSKPIDANIVYNYPDDGTPRAERVWSWQVCSQSYLTNDPAKRYTVLPPRGSLPAAFKDFLKAAKNALDCMQGFEYTERVRSRSALYWADAGYSDGGGEEYRSPQQVLDEALAEKFTRGDAEYNPELYYDAWMYRRLLGSNPHREIYEARVRCSCGWKIPVTQKRLQPDLMVAVHNKTVPSWNSRKEAWEGIPSISLFDCPAGALTIVRAEKIIDPDDGILIWRLFPPPDQLPRPEIPPTPSEENYVEESEVRFDAEYKIFLNFAVEGGFRFRPDYKSQEED